MPKARWNGKVIAESEDVVRLEGNVYFPSAAVRREFLRESKTETVCPWKGTASYWTLEVDGQRNPDSAWFYASPRPAAIEIQGRIAFWRGVEIVE
jgi:uncharacterized protein (DUF427 family)